MSRLLNASRTYTSVVQVHCTTQAAVQADVQFKPSEQVFQPQTSHVKESTSEKKKLLLLW